ncbi:MAG: AI-2E family transporter [Spirochaetales bacterium]|nr:AI-2E family transporter [Spirochaetales bacterium]
MKDTLDRIYHTTRSIRNGLILILIVALVFILKTIASLILPLILAMLLTLIVLPLIHWLKDKGWPQVVIVPLIAVVTLGLVFLIFSIFLNALTEIVGQQEQLLIMLEKKVNRIMDMVNSRYAVDTTGEEAFNWLMGEFDMERVSALIRTAATGLGSFGQSFFLFMLYYIFLLGGTSTYREYVDFVAQDDHRLMLTISSVQNSISTYMVIKSAISLSTAIIVFVICSIMHIEFAFLWGILTFFLNFVPSIGSIIATMPPVIMAFIQYDTFTPMIVTFSLLTATQMTIGNFLDPKIMGDRLRLNTVTVVFGLVFWGYIWGIPGTLLSVPMMVAVKLMLEQSETLGILARVMGYPDRESRKSTRRSIKRHDRRSAIQPTEEDTIREE